MAQEITIGASIKLTKSTLKEQLILNGVFDSMIGDIVDKGVQIIGESAHEQISINSDMGTPGWAMFVNLDDTNFVEIGLEVSATFYPLVKIKPGKSALFELATDTFYAKADTAPVNLQKLIIEQ